jgi:hypothetical protein
MGLENILKSTKNKIGILSAGALIALNPILGCGSDNSVTPNPQPSEHIEYQQETTNQEGYTYFDDDGTEVRIEIQDQNNNPISNATVNYINSEDNNYDIFIVSAQNYIPKLDSFNHNDKSIFTHTINLINAATSGHSLLDYNSKINEISNFLNVTMNNNETNAAVDYLGTYSTEEISDTIRIGTSIALFFAPSTKQEKVFPIAAALTIAGMANSVIPYEDILDIYSSNNDLDLYSIDLNILGLPGLNLPKFYSIMPTNSPELNLENITNEVNSITIDGTTTDIRTYFNFFPDLTPEELNHSRKIIKNHSNGQQEIISFVQNIPNPLPWTIPFNAGNGDYTLELKVIDGSENEDQTQRNFSINWQNEPEGRIVFDKLEGMFGSHSIYIMDSIGLNRRKISSNGGVGISFHNPVINRNLEKVIFTKNTYLGDDICIVDTDGENQMEINNDHQYTVEDWSKDGTKIIVTSDNGIHKINYPTGEISLIYNGTGNEKNVKINETGTKLVFSSIVGNSKEIYTVNMDGTNHQRISSNDGEWKGYPSWSKDGTEVAYSSNADIYLMESNGTNIRNLTNTQNIWEQNSSFGPNGQKILFDLKYISSPHDPEGLFIMNIDGTNKIKIQDTSDTDTNPDWE